MAVASKVFGFPGLTLAAIAEAVIAIKLFPNYWGTSSHLAAVGTILCINYAFGLLFWTILYPRLFSSLRRIPGPKVRHKIHMTQYSSIHHKHNSFNLSLTGAHSRLSSA
jgi:hypothetical protein